MVNKWRPLERPTVEIGQVWRDRDSRMYGRRVRVTNLGTASAVPYVYYRQAVGLTGEPIGRVFRSRRDRFQSAFELTSRRG